MISVAGQIGCSEFSYSCPVISDAGQVPIQGGALTITGQNFGNSIDAVSVFVLFDCEDDTGEVAGEQQQQQQEQQHQQQQQQEEEEDCLGVAHQGTLEDNVLCCPASDSQFAFEKASHSSTPRSRASSRGSSSTMRRIFRGRVIVSVAGQRSQPFGFEYMPPAPPTPIHSAALQAARQRCQNFR